METCITVAMATSLVAAIAAPLLMAIKVLWDRCQTLQDERARALSDAAEHERQRRDEIERILAEVRRHEAHG